MMKNKKAIAPLIATVLLIVIVIAAAAIVWGVVIPLITEQIQTSCLETKTMSIDRSWSCLDAEDCLQFRVVRDSKDFDLKGIIVMVTDKDGNTNNVILGKDMTSMEDCYDGVATDVDLPGKLEEKVYKLSLEELGFEAETELVSIKIAPIIEVEGKEMECDVVSEIPIDSCKI